MPITGPDFLQLCAQADVTPPTATRAYRGGRCEASTIRRLTAAARAMGLPPPPQAAAGPELGIAHIVLEARGGAKP